MFETFTVTARDSETREVFWSVKYDRDQTFDCLADHGISVTELPWCATYDVGFDCILVVSAEVRAYTRQLLAA